MKQLHFASLSFGKDSLDMVHGLVESGAPLDEAVFYDTGMEFQGIYDTRDRVVPWLKSKGIKYTELKPEHPFEWNMFERPVNGRNGFHYGYSWCGGICRWGTTEKIRALDEYAEAHGAHVYVGIAADEPARLVKERKEYKSFPLDEWGLTERQCLGNCYNRGHEWRDSGVRLYDILDRVSCYCCTNKNLKELKNVYTHLPEYWDRLCYLQARTDRPMKGTGKSVFDLEKPFKAELEAERR